MRIIPKNTKVSTEFFKGVTLADMVVGFFGILVIFLIAISSLPYRGYIALGFAFVLAFLLVRIDDESNYMFIFRIICHFSYFRSYRKPGFEYPEVEAAETEEDIETMEESVGTTEETTDNIELFHTQTPVTSSVVAGDMLVLEKEPEINVAVESTERDSEVHVTEEVKEKDPLQLELEEDGFEIIDLDDISVEKESVISKADDSLDQTKKHRKVFGKNKK